MNTKPTPMCLTSAATLLLALLVVLPARAAFIQGVSVSSVSGAYNAIAASNPDRRDASNLVGTTGLFGDQHTIKAGGAMWLSAAGTSPQTNFIVFDLGGVHTVDAIKVWNYNESGTGTARGLKTAIISYSTDNVNFTTNGLTYTFAQAPGTLSACGEVIPMGGFAARYVRLDVVTNYATSPNYVGLSKVRFIENSTPPTILSATENYGCNQVTVLFSESVDLATATNKANYALRTSGTNSATIVSATVGQYNDRVILQTSPLTNSSYSLLATGIKDLALTQPIADTTLVVQPELILWLKADAGVNTDPSGNLTSWTDQSGYGHHAVPATVNQYSATPTLAPGVLNGLPVVSFNGSQLMQVPHDANLAINGDMAVFLVLSSASSQLGDPISKTGGWGLPYSGHSGYTNNMPAPFDIQIAKTSGKPGLTWGGPANGGAAGLGLFSATYGLVNQYYLVSFVVTGTNAACYVNGSFNGSLAVPVNVQDGGNPIMLGVRSDSGNGTNASGGILDTGAQFLGNLAEVMLIRGAATPTDMNAIHQMLGAKYNLPIQPLSIDEQPQSTIAQVGKTATFWVNATGVPPLTYQWKTNGVNVPGATSAIYTTPPLTMAPYNGLNYSVTVTSAIGATNSSTVTLTVVNDSTPPVLSSAIKAANSATIVLVYSEAVTSGALNPINYSLSGGASVLSAASGSASNRVVLTTTTLDPALGYYLTAQNIQDVFGNTLTAATVPVLPASLALHLKGDAGVVADSSGLVVQWLDQTTNGNHALQFVGGPAARPSAGARTLNGKPVLTFNSASSNFLCAASAPSLALTADMSVYVVANVADNDQPREFLSKTGAGAWANRPAPFDFYLWGSRNYSTFLRGDGVTGFASVNGTLPTVGEPHVFAATMAGTRVSLYRDGATDVSGSLNTPIADAGQPLFIGARGDLAQFMNGDLAEVMLFGAALSDVDRILIDNYLANKYFAFTITQQPADITTNVGVAVTFSVAAQQGSGHFVYQWRANGTNIPGATNASYTTPILAPSDNGTTFDVVLTLPGGASHVSNAALLSVNNSPATVASVGKPIWSQTNLVLVFSHVLDSGTASAAANYSLDNGASVLTAALGDAPTKVVLTTTPLSPGTAYTLTIQNVQDPYHNTTATTAVPVGIYPPATALWLKADTGVTADADGYVSQWNDLSGNGNHLLQPYGAPYTPQWVPNAIGGWPALRFNATNITYMYSLHSPSLAITGDMAIFAVMNFHDYLASYGSSTIGGGEIISKTALNMPAPFDYYVRPQTSPTATPALWFYRGNGSAAAYSSASTTPAAGAGHLLSVQMQGTTVTHRLDGRANGGGTLSVPIADAGHPVYIGAREDSAERLNGDMAELILIGSALSASDAAALERYLMAKYNYFGINLASTNLSAAVAGNQLTLSWPADHIGWQLQSNAVSLLATSAWFEVPGATSTNRITLPINTAKTNVFFRMVYPQ